MERVELARRLSEHLHAGQTRKNGEPYFAHCERVALSVASKGDHVQIVAWMHDVLEDTGFGLTCIAALFGWGIAADIVRLTRKDGQSYSSYIGSICEYGSLAALIVKLADIHDNLRDPPGDLRERYVRAAGKLTAEARRRGLHDAPP